MLQRRLLQKKYHVFRLYFSFLLNAYTHLLLLIVSSSVCYAQCNCGIDDEVTIPLEEMSRLGLKGYEHDDQFDGTRTIVSFTNDYQIDTEQIHRGEEISTKKYRYSQDTLYISTSVLDVKSDRVVAEGYQTIVKGRQRLNLSMRSGYPTILTQYLTLVKDSNTLVERVIAEEVSEDLFETQAKADTIDIFENFDNEGRLVKKKFVLQSDRMSRRLLLNYTDSIRWVYTYAYSDNCVTQYRTSMDSNVVFGFKKVCQRQKNKHFWTCQILETCQPTQMYTYTEGDGFTVYTRPHGIDVVFFKRDTKLPQLVFMYFFGHGYLVSKFKYW
jgi:hypothetical protein